MLEIPYVPKILVLDVETKPLLAYTWSLFAPPMSPDKLVEHGGLLCAAAKWLGQEERFFYSEWEHGREAMVRAILALIAEADAVVTFNGDKFDIPILMAEFALLGLAPPPPTTSIDVYKLAVKLLHLPSRKLDYVAQRLGVGEKVKHSGMQLWIDVMNGIPAARSKMKEYNIGDIDILEGVYMQLRPFIKNHPHMGFTPKRECGACGSARVHVSKYRRTKAMRIQQLHCQDCGSYFDGVREKV